ncbi:predicted protein [Uncinocarpus reesii 1704]|uniref:Uncharacterized protein n=1 Tax=Uncinocarpus reesii (strain UAMH 1704) TaxID=336963 RepID=C4JSG2_UNCRE|nr:uncharacterized protein UREG_05401 [Uncinocarpus reesii 1704]EEP80559.1 predicted protein [Uncinocarpus reesii 1704]
MSTTSSAKVERQGFVARSQPQTRGRKRKLSNAAQPLDIGEQDDELMDESGG